MSLRGLQQGFGILDGGGHRFLDQHVLAGFEGFDRQRDVELVGDGDDHGVDVVVGEHRVVIGECGGRLVDGGHSLAQVVGGVADRIQLRSLGLAYGGEVRRLRDLTGSEDPDIEGAAGQNDRSFGDVGVLFVDGSWVNPTRSRSALAGGCFRPEVCRHQTTCQARRACRKRHERRASTGSAHMRARA